MTLISPRKLATVAAWVAADTIDTVDRAVPAGLGRGRRDSGSTLDTSRMHLKVAAPAAIVCTRHLCVAGVTNDPGPCRAARLVSQRVTVAGEGVGRTGQVQIKVAVVAAVAGAPSAAAAAITGEVAALVADQRARVAVVVDHDASLIILVSPLFAIYADRGRWDGCCADRPSLIYRLETLFRLITNTFDSYTKTCWTLDKSSSIKSSLYMC